jgi:hypothetical protein
MTEQEARSAIIHWAKRYDAEYDEPVPEVTVLSLTYDEYESEWTAELAVSTSAENPTVTFWLNEGHRKAAQENGLIWLEENWLHVENIEYRVTASAEIGETVRLEIIPRK